MSTQFCHCHECDGRGEIAVERRDNHGDYLDTVYVCSIDCQEEVLAQLDEDNRETDEYEREADEDDDEDMPRRISTANDPWIICPACHGDGTHVNPNIDAGGISAETFAEDPDFAESYFSGAFDQACRVCDQTGKIRQSKVEQLQEEADERELSMHESGVYEPGVRDFRFSSAG